MVFFHSLWFAFCLSFARFYLFLFLSFFCAFVCFWLIIKNLTPELNYEGAKLLPCWDTRIACKTGRIPVTPPTHDFRYLQLFLIFTMFPSPRSSNPSHSYTVTHHILSSHMVRLFYAKIKWRFLLKVSEIHQFQRDWLTAEITWLVIRFTESHSAVGGCFAHQAPCKICMFNRAFAALQLSPA